MLNTTDNGKCKYHKLLYLFQTNMVNTTEKSYSHMGVTATAPHMRMVNTYNIN